MPEMFNPTKPPVLRCNGFQFCRDRFTLEDTDIARVEGPRLHGLLHPETLSLQGRMVAAEEARKLFKKDFFAAQLRFYGIEFRMSSKVADLRSLLEESVHHGKCDVVPEPIARLEQRMCLEYESMYQAWKKQVRAWDEEKRQRETEAKAREKERQDAAFAQCKTPSEKASYDLQRFMDFYYLNEGKPDKSKTPAPMVLQIHPRGLDKKLSLHDLSQRYDLHTKFCMSHEGPRHCIGWDRDAVYRLADNINKEKKEAERRERDTDYQRCVARARQRCQSQGNTSFELRQCVGSYSIECDAALKFDKRYENNLTMDISTAGNETLIAAYDFGVIKGTMLLSLSEENLDAITGAVSKQQYYSDYDDEEYDEDSDEATNTLAKTVPKTVANKRAAGGPSNASKKRKRIPTLSRRVYYRLRGQETGEGQIIPDSAPGHLEFLSDGCTKFVGLAYDFPYIDRNVRFLGYKVSEQPLKKPDPWDAFSYGTYGLASTGRWN
ncbi:uncharacterized protein J3D65DRAFT_272125 [Phyllosticta citribraziliensis]|uniref:Uncharacterized protein n=1 Tax=Phyllosticta citribraziliensis TaxID=989973 RepID=A0ABR1M1B4_9PEZI